MIRGRLVALASVLAALHVTPAHADEPPPAIQLSYGVKGDGCPDETKFRRDVAVRLGGDPFVAESALGTRRLVVSVDAITTRPSVTVTLADAAGKVLGRRVITEPSSSCDELVANAAFAASVAIDPSVLTRPPPAPPEPATVPEPAPVPTPAPTPPIADEPEPAAPSTRLGLRVGAAASFGLLPASSFALALAGSLRGRVWSAGLEGRFDLPTESEHAVAGSTANVRTSLLTGGLFACGHLATTSVDPYLCAVTSVGALRSASSGIAIAKDDVSPYVAAGPRAGVAIPFSKAVALDLRVDVPFAITAVELRIDQRALWTSPTLAALLGVGLSFSGP